jgi:hypothetical protein
MSMERTEVLEMMGELKLYGMKSAYDETLATALKPDLNSKLTLALARH